jgi:hypothetical protein
MNASRVIFAVLACVVGFAALGRAAPAKPAKADPREKLETAIPEGIRLLEAKEHKTFLQKFAAPDDLARFTRKLSLEELARQFGKDKAVVLLKILRSVKGKKPTIEAKGKKATFKHNVKGAGKESISFVKVDKFWYIQN